MVSFYVTVTNILELFCSILCVYLSFCLLFAYLNAFLKYVQIKLNKYLGDRTMVRGQEVQGQMLRNCTQNPTKSQFTLGSSVSLPASLCPKDTVHCWVLLVTGEDFSL